MSLKTNSSAFELKQGRRRFLLRLSWTGLGLFLTTFLAAVLNFFWPRVPDRPSRSFQVGFPEDYQPGQVVYYSGRKLFIIRDEKGFYSLSARCTHLGCNVPWDQVEERFICPCHNSQFTTQGEVLNPPAPRPLDLFPISIEDGQVLVDTAKPQERQKYDTSQEVHA